jgi:hypothetical protein
VQRAGEGTLGIDHQPGDGCAASELPSLRCTPRQDSV